MAELIWQAADPNAAGHVATYNSYGAIVKVIRNAPETPPPHSVASPLGGEAGVPAWVRVAQGLAANRIREYKNETGQLPSSQLLEDFQRVMGERLNAYIEEPMKHPFHPMTLKAFEDEIKQTFTAKVQ